MMLVLHANESVCLRFFNCLSRTTGSLHQFLSSFGPFAIHFNIHDHIGLVLSLGVAVNVFEALVFFKRLGVGGNRPHTLAYLASGSFRQGLVRQWGGDNNTSNASRHHGGNALATNNSLFQTSNRRSVSQGPSIRSVLFSSGINFRSIPGSCSGQDIIDGDDFAHFLGRTRPHLGIGPLHSGFACRKLQFGGICRGGCLLRADSYANGQSQRLMEPGTTRNIAIALL